jgi:hypothetical protein
MDDTQIHTPIDTPIDATTSPAEREQDLAILEALEVELAEVESALQRLDGTDDVPLRADVDQPG